MKKIPITLQTIYNSLPHTVTVLPPSDIVDPLLWNLETITPSDYTEDDPNFMDYYKENHESLDRLFVRQHGEKIIDLWMNEGDEENPSKIVEAWRSDANGVFAKYFYSWFVLFVALNTKYNPLWNKEGSEKVTYSEFETEFEKGEQEDESTNGQRVSTSEGSNKAYNSGLLPKISEGKTTMNQSTDKVKSGSRTDTTTEKSHDVETVFGGNLGITKTQELIESEYNLRMFTNFFNGIQEVYLVEMGAYYE